MSSPPTSIHVSYQLECVVPISNLRGLAAGSGCQVGTMTAAAEDVLKTAVAVAGDG
jgi:hypothetical protein